MIEKHFRIDLRNLREDVTLEELVRAASLLGLELHPVLTPSGEDPNSIKYLVGKCIRLRKLCVPIRVRWP